LVTNPLCSFANPGPLTRPEPADESAVAGHPPPQGGEGISATSGETKDHGIFARIDKLFRALRSAFSVLLSAF
jgi:hypothetical protein